MALPQTLRSLKEISNELNKWNIKFYSLSEEMINAPIVSAYKKGRFEYYKDVEATLSSLEVWLAKALMALIYQIRNDCEYLEGIVIKQPHLSSSAIKKIEESMNLLEEIKKDRNYFGEDSRNLRILKRSSERTFSLLRNMKSRISKIETHYKKKKFLSPKSELGQQKSKVVQFPISNERKK